MAFTKPFAAFLVDLANDIERVETNPPSRPPSTEFDSLRGLVGTLGLKGNETVVVGAICDGQGRVPIADLALRFHWGNPQDNWNGARKRLNKKFKGSNWRFSLESCKP